MKVIVTGGAGFIGSHVVDRLLELGHSVVVFDDFSSGRESNLFNAKEMAKKQNVEIKTYKQDIRSKTAWENLDKAEALFHFAAQTSVTASFDDPQLDFDSNALATLHVLNWIKTNKPKAYLFSNTAGALYGAASTIPTSEETPLWPESLYGATKCFGEIYLNAFVTSLKAQNTFSSSPTDENYFSWASLRLGNVYGERQITKGEAGVVPIFADLFSRAKAPIVFGEEAVTRDYVHVSDVADAFILAFKKITEQNIDCGINIGTGVETSSEEVYSHVYSAFKETSYFEKISEFSTPKRAPLRAGELVRSCLNISKAKQLLNWSPNYQFSQSVADVVRYYLANELK